MSNQWRCKYCKDEGHVWVRMYVLNRPMYCPKPCSCTVIGHTAVDVFNSMRDEDDCKLLRFPIENVTPSTRLPNKESKILDIIDFVKEKNSLDE